MTATQGLLGDVVSWGGTFNTAVLALIKPAGFTANLTAASLDVTGYAAGAAVVRSKIKGLKGISGNIEGFLATPNNGIAGSVSGPTYTSNVRSWNMSIKAAALETTAWPVTATNWRTFLPGLVEWSGSYEALVDSSTAITEAGEAAEPLSATFTIASGQTLAGTIFNTSAAVVSRVGELNVVRYSYEGTGHIVSVGTSNLVPAASTLALPVAGTLILKMAEEGATDKALSFSAFWTELSIDVSPQNAVTIGWGFQGSGAVSIT